VIRKRVVIPYHFLVKGKALSGTYSFADTLTIDQITFPDTIPSNLGITYYETKPSFCQVLPFLSSSQPGSNPSIHPFNPLKRKEGPAGPSNEKQMRHRQTLSHHIHAAAVFPAVVLGVMSLLTPAKADGATVNAASCSRADVQAAIDATAEGDTVNIPSGSCTWDSQVSVSEGISLVGAGIGSTVISDAMASNAPALLITTASGKAYRVTNFSWLVDGIDRYGMGSIKVAGNSESVRIDHLSLTTHSNTNGIVWSGFVFGVIDSSTFTIYDGIPLYLMHTGWGGAYLRGEGSWTDPLYLGSNIGEYPTSPAVYVEGNTFDGTNYPSRAAMDCENGARLVFRYNYLNDSHVATHGTETGYPNRAPRSWEIYNNQLTSTTNYAFGMDIRGGSGVIYNNTYVGFQRAIRIATFRTFYGATNNWYSCDGLSGYDANDATVYDSGTYSGSATGGALSVIFSGESWTEDQWVGFSLLNVTVSPGRSSIITSNTADTITFLGTGRATPNLTFSYGDAWQIRKANFTTGHIFLAQMAG
jgi:hypothetical protein